MKKQKHLLAAGAMLCSAFAGLAMPISSVSASSLFDNLATNTGFDAYQHLFACVMDAYKNANNVDDDYLETLDAAGEPLPAEGLANITDLVCTASINCQICNLLIYPTIT